MQPAQKARLGSLANRRALHHQPTYAHPAHLRRNKLQVDPDLPIGHGPVINP
jgi:hypothetical protein